MSFVSSDSAAPAVNPAPVVMPSPVPSDGSPRFPDVVVPASVVPVSGQKANSFLVMSAVSKALGRAGHVEAGTELVNRAFALRTYGEVVALVHEYVTVLGDSASD